VEIKINEQRLCQIPVRLQDAQKREEWILIKGKDFTPVKQAQKRSNWAGRADRIYRINWIEGPSAQGHLAAGEKILLIL